MRSRGLSAAALIWSSSVAAQRRRRAAGENELLQILLFFTKAGAFVFGSGLAIVPFLQQGVVRNSAGYRAEFLDAVAVALITPARS